jgi:hypothetical protein
MHATLDLLSQTANLTGGTPELNPGFQRLMIAARARGPVTR